MTTHSFPRTLRLAAGIFISSAILTLSPSGATAKSPEIAPSYAWSIIPPLGLHEAATIDTSFIDYAQRSVPSSLSPAYATTGLLGGSGETLIFFDREPMGDFFFENALTQWIPSLSKMRYYNTRIPMTLLSYNTAGGKENAQDRLHGIFSGNFSPVGQVGALVDYIYSKGCYDNQHAKDLAWGFSGSYIGDRYELQTFFNAWNFLQKNNGGITDDLYITDPAQLQGGQTSIQPKAIPTRLKGAFNRTTGSQFYANNTYKVGYWHEEEIDDTTTLRTYIPVTKFVWTLDYRRGRHVFVDNNAADDTFWDKSYLRLGGSYDKTTYWTVTNTLGIQLLEEFNKFAKFGISAFMTHQMRSYTLPVDTITGVLEEYPDGLTPSPFGQLPSTSKDNLLWVGGQLTKQRGSLLTYEATARFGLSGPVVGDVEVDGRVSTRFRLFGDSVTITGYGRFSNTEVPYLLNQYVSNHFIWNNNFGKIRRLKFGGHLDIPHTGTSIDVGVENLQNYVYFNSSSLPTQNGGSVQVLGATVNQNFRFGPVYWNNSLIYQTTSDETTIPLPKFSIYTNLSLQFKVAKVLSVQLGVDCSYYTKYYSVSYQPATMAFYNQREIKCGNYPVMNAFANFKLSKVRFYVMMSHVNQGLTGDEYFSMPHYPINPRRFQIGLSVDFPN